MSYYIAWNMSHFFFICLFIYIYSLRPILSFPVPLGVIYLRLWASDLGACQKPLQNRGWEIDWQWDPFKYVSSLSRRNGQPGPETSGDLFVLWKTVVMLGRLGDLQVHKSVRRVSLPYKSDHEWESGWCHNNVQCTATSEPQHLNVRLRKRVW